MEHKLSKPGTFRYSKLEPTLRQWSKDPEFLVSSVLVKNPAFAQIIEY